MDTDMQWLGTALYWGSLISGGVLLALTIAAWRTIRRLKTPPKKPSTEFDAAMVRAIRKMEGKILD